MLELKIMHFDLFQENNHSKYKIYWKTIDQVLYDELAELIKSQYLFSAVHEIHQVDEWERMSNNFKIIVSIDNGKKEILFRKNIQLHDTDIIDLIHKVISHLSSSPVPVAKHIKIRDGKSYFKEGEYYYEALEFIEGDHYSGTKEELKQSAQGIARLHQAFNKITFDEQIKNRPVLLQPFDNDGWAHIFEQAAVKKDTYSLVLSEQEAFLRTEIETVLNSKNLTENFETQVIHGDLHPQNMIFNNNKLAAIIDFEGVRYDTLIVDIANACHRFVRQYVVKKGGDWQKTLADGLDIFIESYKAINEVPSSELAMIPNFIRDELLRKLYKDLNDYYNDDNTSKIENGELEKKISLLAEAEPIANSLTTII